MSEVLLFSAAAMTLMAVWRLPALRYRDPLRRAIWNCCATFSVALWCRVPAVKAAMDSSAVVDLSALVKYVTGLAPLLAMLRYSAAIHASPPSGRTPRHAAVVRQVNRAAHAMAWAALSAMVLLFFFAVDRSEPSVDFATDHAGEWGACAFMTIMYAYLGSACGIFAYQWGRAARRAETVPLRLGLSLMAAAATIYCIYPAVRISVIWFPIGLEATTVRTIADSVNLAVATLFVSGVAVPSSKSLVARWVSMRSLIRLRPMWHDLMGQFPELVFQPTGSAAQDLVGGASVDVRLDRRIQEIADATELLRHHASPELLDAVEAAVGDHDDPGAAAEALWISAALQCAREGRRNRFPSRSLPTKPLINSTSEAHWLARVQAAYASMPHALVEQVIMAAGRPAPAGR